MNKVESKERKKKISYVETESQTYSGAYRFPSSLTRVNLLDQMSNIGKPPSEQLTNSNFICRKSNIPKPFEWFVGGARATEFEFSISL